MYLRNFTISRGTEFAFAVKVATTIDFLNDPSYFSLKIYQVVTGIIASHFWSIFIDGPTSVVKTSIPYDYWEYDDIGYDNESLVNLLLFDKSYWWLSIYVSIEPETALLSRISAMIRWFCINLSAKERLFRHPK